MQILLSVIHVLVGLFLILVVLLQTGRSGGMGAGFGGGSNTGVFGARGANPFLSKLTAASAIIFFFTSMTLSILSSKVGSVVADQETPAAAAPATPEAAVENHDNKEGEPSKDAVTEQRPMSPVEVPPTGAQSK